MSTVQTLASAAAARFETATRANGEEYVRVREGSPDWIRDMCHAAHGDMFPDDHRYAMIASALAHIAGTDDPWESMYLWANDEVSPYNGERLRWLASHGDRVAYCDEAADEIGAGEAGMIDRIGYGWYMEAEEVYGYVLGFLEGTVAKLTESEDA